MKTKKLNVKEITEKEILRFWGDDEKEEMSRYTSMNLNRFIRGHITGEELIDTFRNYPSEEVEAIADYFHLRLEEIEDETDEVPEQYGICLGTTEPRAGIEWCKADSDTVRDLGADCFKKVKVKGKVYYWRWL